MLSIIMRVSSTPTAVFNFITVKLSSASSLRKMGAHLLQRKQRRGLERLNNLCSPTQLDMHKFGQRATKYFVRFKQTLLPGRFSFSVFSSVSALVSPKNLSSIFRAAKLASNLWIRVVSLTITASSDWTLSDCNSVTRYRVAITTVTRTTKIARMRTTNKVRMLRRARELSRFSISAR